MCRSRYDLLASPPHLYDMLGIDDKYDAAFEGFVRKAHAKSQPFFFYFCSHHTHAPQFAPDDFRGYSVRGATTKDNVAQRLAARVFLSAERTIVCKDRLGTNTPKEGFKTGG